MPTNAVLVQDYENAISSTPLFQLSFAQTVGDLIECQRLRYLVFNCELGGGLKNSEQSGFDRDHFDLICDHIMVRDATSGQLVGTYRMQTGYRAKGNLGYYSSSLFDLAPFEPIRGELLELGRACVHSDHRNRTVLAMLWKGIAQYAELCNARYLIGCSSLSSQNANEGFALYHALAGKHLAAPEFHVQPWHWCRCQSSAPESEFANVSAPICDHPPHQTTPPGLPRLFRAYLDISARLCGPPAIDRDFKTIDFLTLVDLHSIPDRVRSRFFT
jgi:putative hemolysin